VLRLSQDGRRVHVLAVAAMAALIAGGAVAFAGADGRPRAKHRNTGAKVTTTEFGTVIVRQTDRKRGLIFELQGARGEGDALYVRLARNAPKATRDALLSRPLAGTCRVPGVKVHSSAGQWNERFQQYGTALWADDPSMFMTGRATECALYVGSEAEYPDEAYFDGPPFSRVRMK
jgi:hypothetical protein